MTTRAKKIDFIRSFGPYALEKAVEDILRRKEARWLTDEQIDDITEKMVSDARFTQHLNMQNRAARRQLQAAE